MKIWNDFGSEHSARLVLIGKFKTIACAVEAKESLELLIKQVEKEARLKNEPEKGVPDRYSKDMLVLLEKIKIHSIEPGELEQLSNPFSFELKESTLVIDTEEIDVSAFLKLMIDNGARVEIYSRHDYPERTDKQDE